MQYRKLSRQGPTVSSIGLGCMSLGIADTYSSSVQGEEGAVALIQRALDLGITLLDTADIYGNSERYVAKAIRGRREGIVIATKFGFAREVKAGGVKESERIINGSPQYVREACERSLQRLGIDCIDLYYLHRVDATVPIEDTVGAMAGLVRDGKVKHLGLSEPSVDTLRRAQQVHPITAVQSEYSLFTRDPEAELLPELDKMGISLVAYSPLGRGFLAGRFRSVDELAEDDWRRNNPRFQGENFERNVALGDRVREVAEEKGCTPAQLALAWMLNSRDNVVPIPGTSSLKRLEENAAAADMELSDEELAQIEEVSPSSAVAGKRYDPGLLGLVNR